MKTFSVVCPLRNEIKYLDKIVRLIENINPVPLNFFLVDGESTDGTKEYLRAAFSNHPFVKVLDNPQKTVPYALNIAIPLCKGDIIVRLDAHTEYDSGYFQAILATFEKTNADIVGGPMRIANGTSFQNAVGWVTSNSFGVGNSSFHFADFEGYTDSVYLGAWKKTVFEATGLFDVNLVRNQDDEFHYRAKSLGFTVYQSPSIISYYYPRSNIKTLVKQYFQYGLYKPMVLKKVRSEIKLRHIIPTLFVLYLVAGISLSLFLGMLSFIPLLLYILIVLYLSLIQPKPLKEKVIGMFVFPIIHISYGCGFISGSLKT